MQTKNVIKYKIDIQAIFYLLDRRYWTGSSTQLGAGERRFSDCHGGPKS